MSNNILQSLERLKQKRLDTPRVRYQYGGGIMDEVIVYADGTKNPTNPYEGFNPYGEGGFNDDFSGIPTGGGGTGSSDSGSGSGSGYSAGVDFSGRGDTTDSDTTDSTSQQIDSSPETGDRRLPSTSPDTKPLFDDTGNILNPDPNSPTYVSAETLLGDRFTPSTDLYGELPEGTKDTGSVYIDPYTGRYYRLVTKENATSSQIQSDLMLFTQLISNQYGYNTDQLNYLIQPLSAFEDMSGVASNQGMSAQIPSVTSIDNVVNNADNNSGFMEEIKVWADKQRQQSPLFNYGAEVLGEVFDIVGNLPSTIINPTGQVVDVIDAVFAPVTDRIGNTLRQELLGGLDLTEEQIKTKIDDGGIEGYFSNLGSKLGDKLTTDWFSTFLDPQGAMYEWVSEGIAPELGEGIKSVEAWIDTNMMIPLVKNVPEGLRTNAIVQAGKEIIGRTLGAVTDNFTESEDFSEHLRANSTFLTKVNILGDALSEAGQATFDEALDAVKDVLDGIKEYNGQENKLDASPFSAQGPNYETTYNAEDLTNLLDTFNQGMPASTGPTGTQPTSDEATEFPDQGASEGGEITRSPVDWNTVNWGGGITYGTNGGTTVSTESRERPQVPTLPDAKEGVVDTDATIATDDTAIEQLDPTGVAATVTDRVDAVDPLTPTAAVAGTASAAPTLTPTTVTATQAATPAEAIAAQGTVSEDAQSTAAQSTITSPAVAAERDAAAEQGAMAQTSEFDISTTSYVDKVTGEQVQVASTPDAEAKTRNAITDDTYSQGEAAEIIDTLGYEVTQRRPITGEAARGAAIDMIAEVGDMPPEIAVTLVENPAEVIAQIDNDPVEVQAVIAALPEEALVSAQMENLLGSMEEGKTPVWARPAVDKVNSMLAARGMSISTVGRDTLFNAIIESALPLAQGNAEALQTRAAQNLDNQQQAAVVTAQLDMNRRLQNLQNKQTAASQTAQMANDVKILNAKLKQETNITGAQQQQQMRLANLENRQRAAEMNARNQQETASLNLSNEQQMNLANLEIEAEVDRDNMTADNQRKLAEMQVAADFLSKNAELKQQMTIANMSNEQQMKLANLQARNDASADNLNAAQKTELANMQKDLNTRLKSAELAQQMNVAQLNVDQQAALQNAQMVANVDLAKFDAAQQVELVNSKFMQTMVAAEFDAEQQAILQNATAQASMDIANADNRTKVSIQNAQNFLAMDMANLDNEQQVNVLKSQQEQQRLLANQSADNAAKQFNAQSQNQTDQFMAQLGAQIDQFNVASQDAMKQFNASEQNKADAQNADNELKVAMANSTLEADMNRFNAELQSRREQWNAANAQAIEQSNIAWRRQSNLADTAADNAANLQNVQNEYNLTSINLSSMWQQLRDEGTFAHNAAENYQNRMVQLYGLAIGNEQAAGAATINTTDLISAVSDILNGNVS